MNNMTALIEGYLKSKEMAWETTTINSERARLTANILGLSVEPEAFYKKLSEYKKPYTIKTIFIRLGEFQEWLISNGQAHGTNQFKQFIKTNRKLFANAYEKEKLDVTFEEALERIKKIDEQELREKALQLISSGARWKESTTLDGSGFVKSKGGRTRKLLNGKSVRYGKSYSHFLRQLKKATGLKPHSLRKLFATHLLNNGMPIHDVKEIMGHASIETTAIYAQAKKDSELQERIEKLVG